MNSLKPIILVDIDAPLAKWEEGLVDVARARHPHIYTADAGTRTSWDLTLGLSEEEKAAIFEVMHLPGFYRNLEPVEGSVRALHEMLNDNLEVFLCSTPSLDNPTCASDKLAWVGEHFGREIAKRTILTLDKTMVHGDVLIDDKDVITGLRQPSWTRIVFDRAYNGDAPGPRMWLWPEWARVVYATLDGQAAA
jgi:5'(3')-deoxyribonucleotidase